MGCHDIGVRIEKIRGGGKVDHAHIKADDVGILERVVICPWFSADSANGFLCLSDVSHRLAAAIGQPLGFRKEHTVVLRCPEAQRPPTAESGPSTVSFQEPDRLGYFLGALPFFGVVLGWVEVPSFGVGFPEEITGAFGGTNPLLLWQTGAFGGTIPS